MSADQTRQVISAYFEAMGTGRFSQFFTADVTWTTIQNAAEVRGAEAVEKAIIGLHARLQDLDTRQLVFAESAAYIEGSGSGGAGKDRVSYCVAYDLAGDRIAAMRAYGNIAEYMPR